MVVLGIETSCDETAAAVVRDGYEVLSSVIHTQIALHSPHGGVVPEIASRSHLEKLPSVTQEALSRAGLGLEQIDAIAVTYGPGLASSLLVGISFAKGLAWATGKKLLGVDHVYAHIQSAFLTPGAPPLDDSLPLLALAVSGGHSAIAEILPGTRPRILGQTLDDAAGEAFDKASKLLGLGYPGGPKIEKAAAKALGDGGIKFPQGRISKSNPVLGDLDADLCFSFSGLKTSLRSHLQNNPADTEEKIASVAFAYQSAIVGAICSRIDIALGRKKYKALAVGGGVSLNSALRHGLASVAKKRGVPLFLPEARFCGDNAAMIASLASTGRANRSQDAFEIDATPDLTF